MKIVYSFLVFSTLLVSCSSNNPDSEEKKDVEISNANSSIKIFSLGDVSVKWTAFKHSKKAPVAGKFDSVNVVGFEPSDNILSSISGVSIQLPVASSNSNDKVRDNKIYNTFFGNLLNTSIISGEIKTLNSDGSGVLSIKMNALEKDVSFNWEMDETNEFFLKTSINILDWNGASALDALNAVCLEKHTGPDGVNKLWPNVDVIVLAQLLVD